MSALFRWALTLPFIILIVGFSALHSEKITLNLEPVYKNTEVPLFVPLIFFVFIGFFWGAFINWVNSAPLRQKTRVQNKEIKALKKEISALQDKASGANGSAKKSSLSNTAFDLLPSAKPKAIENSDLL